MNKKYFVYALIFTVVVSGSVYFLMRENPLQIMVPKEMENSGLSIDGIKLKNVSIKSSFDWKKEVKDMLPDGCEPSIVGVPLYGLNDTSTKQSISFPAYVCNDPDYGFGTSTKWLARDGVLKYTNYYDEREGPVWNDEASVVSFGNYWFLNGGRPEDIISAIIKALPTPEQRRYCYIEKNTSDGTYIINYEKELESFVPEGDPLWGMCGEFGMSNGLQVFRQVGDILLFLYLGQDVPPYDYQNITSK